MHVLSPTCHFFLAEVIAEGFPSNYRSLEGGMLATRAGAGGTRALHGGVDRQNPALGNTCCRARGDLYNFTRVIGTRVGRRA